VHLVQNIVGNLDNTAPELDNNSRLLLADTKGINKSTEVTDERQQAFSHLKIISLKNGLGRGVRVGLRDNLGQEGLRCQDVGGKRQDRQLELADLLVVMGTIKTGQCR